MNDFCIYIIILLAIIVGIIVVKKVTSCLFRIAFTVLAVIILAALYYLYI